MSSHKRTFPKGVTIPFITPISTPVSVASGVLKPLQRKTIIVDNIPTFQNTRVTCHGKKCDCGAEITRSRIKSSTGNWIVRYICTVSTCAAKNCPLAKRN